MNSLIRFTPRHDVRSLQREFDRLFNTFLPVHNGNGDLDNAVWAPRTDLSETEDAYLIHLDLPGLTKKEVEINFHEGTLSISGERQKDETTEGGKFVRTERSYGRFYRAFSLPKTVDTEGIEATFKNGVLNIRVPKVEEAKPRRIDIR